MGQLPCAGDAQQDQLHQGPPHDTSICAFGLVTKLGFTFLDDHMCQAAAIAGSRLVDVGIYTDPLKDLFPSDIDQTLVQIPDLLGQLPHSPFICSLDRVRFPNG